MPEFRRCCSTSFSRKAQAQCRRAGRNRDRRASRSRAHFSRLTPRRWSRPATSKTTWTTSAVRLDHRSRHRKSGHQARPAGAKWRRCARPGRILSTNTSGIPLAQISEGFASEFRAAFSGHALLQSAALSAPGRNDSGRGHAARGPRLRRAISATAAWARASCPARTRRTSSPTASAASSAPPFTRSRSRTTTPSKKSTRSPAPLIGLPQERQLPAAGHRRPRRLGARHAQPATTRCPTIRGATASCCRRFWRR